MAKNPNQKLKILYIMQMLMNESDEAHGLTMADILDRLDEHDIKAERKSIYDDLETLRRFGIDIITDKNGKTTNYYIGNRDFEYPELTLLVDAVQSSRFLTEKKSNALIRKIENLTSKFEASLLDKRVHVAGRIKMQNESIFYNVDAIQDAIARKKKLSFKYYDYNISKEKIARRDGAAYIADPVGLTYVDENYYLITYYHQYDSLVNFRVDRMANIKVTDEAAELMPDAASFDMEGYCRKSFSMFGGEDTHVEIVFDKSLMNAIVDRFGKDVFVQKIDDNSTRAHVAITKSRSFFGWLTAFGDMMMIEKPESLKKEYIEYLKSILASY
jgi:predicted DNA-binding transcriptional regulator YafY